MKEIELMKYELARNCYFVKDKENDYIKLCKKKWEERRKRKLEYKKEFRTNEHDFIRVLLMRNGEVFDSHIETRQHELTEYYKGILKDKYGFYEKHRIDNLKIIYTNGEEKNIKIRRVA